MMKRHTGQVEKTRPVQNKYQYAADLNQT